MIHYHFIAEVKKNIVLLDSNIESFIMCYYLEEDETGITENLIHTMPEHIRETVILEISDHTEVPSWIKKHMIEKIRKNKSCLVCYI